MSQGVSLIKYRTDFLMKNVTSHKSMLLAMVIFHNKQLDILLLFGVKYSIYYVEMQIG